MGGIPLAKSAAHALPPQTLRQIVSIEALLKTVKKEDWDNPVPYAGGEYPALVRAHMKAALLSPQPFEKYSPDQPRVPAGNPDDGQWTSEGGDSGGVTETRAENYDPVAHTTPRRDKVSPNRHVSQQDGITEEDLQNPRFAGMDNTHIKKQKFVDAHLDVTEKAAKELNVPVANLLGVAALESGWGRDKFPRVGNNYFGQHSPAPLQVNSFPVDRDPTVRGAKFNSYSDSLQSFIQTRGDLIQSISDPAQFAQALQDSGAYGIIKGGTIHHPIYYPDPTYVPKVVETIENLSSNIARTRQQK